MRLCPFGAVGRLVRCSGRRCRFRGFRRGFRRFCLRFGLPLGRGLDRFVSGLRHGLRLRGGAGRLRRRFCGGPAPANNRCRSRRFFFFLADGRRCISGHLGLMAAPNRHRCGRLRRCCGLFFLRLFHPARRLGLRFRLRKSRRRFFRHSGGRCGRRFGIFRRSGGRRRLRCGRFERFAARGTEFLCLKPCRGMAIRTYFHDISPQNGLAFFEARVKHGQNGTGRVPRRAVLQWHRPGRGEQYPSLPQRRHPVSVPRCRVPEQQT